MVKELPQRENSAEALNGEELLNLPPWLHPLITHTTARVPMPAPLFRQVVFAAGFFLARCGCAAVVGEGAEVRGGGRGFWGG